MNPARLTKTEVQQIIIETIKGNSFYSLDDFIDITVLRSPYSKEVTEFGLIYSPRRISEKKINTFEEFDGETDLDEPLISYFSIGIYLQNQDQYCEEELKKYNEVVKPLREIGFKMPPPEPRLRGDIEFLIPSILPRYRKQGNGRRLVQLIEDIAKKMGLESIREIMPLIAEEKNFLEHLGYHISPKESKYYASKKLI